MTAAEELREAAGRLRALAESATSGRWESDGVDEVFAQYSLGEVWVATCGPDDRDKVTANAAYIAAMHPEVALRLADLFDRILLRVDEYAETVPPRLLDSIAASECLGYVEALAVARALTPDAPRGGEDG